MRASVELQKKLDEAVKRIVEEDKAGNDGEIMVAAAKELGYDISIASLEQAKAEAEPLDPAALEAVAGGKRTYITGTGAKCDFVSTQEHVDEEYHNGWCIAVWHCFTASLHTASKEEDISCWSDYNCCWLNKGDGKTYD